MFLSVGWKNIGEIYSIIVSHPSYSRSVVDETGQKSNSEGLGICACLAGGHGSEHAICLEQEIIILDRLHREHPRLGQRSGPMIVHF